MKKFETYESQIQPEIQRAVQKGATIGGIMGLFGAIAVAGVLFSGRLDHMVPPLFWALFASGFSFLVAWFAKKGWIFGWKTYVLFLPYVSIPFVLFLFSHFMLPSGAATFLNGPPAQLGLILIMLTVFMFNTKLSVISGLVVGIEYFISYLLARPFLSDIQVPDAALYNELVSYDIHAIKTFMYFFAGFIAAGLSIVIRRFIVQIVEGESEKERINKLFSQYVSDEVREKVVKEKIDQIGEIKKMTVLFSDIRGFTSFSESNSCKTVVGHLNEYFDEMGEAIESNKGIIDKFIGDAIMATFGGVINNSTPEKATTSAVRAAAGMRLGLKRLNKKWKAEGRPLFENGIGMHYGEVIEGNIGSARRKDFTVVGDAVNTAARIEGISKQYPDYGILITEGMYRTLPESYQKHFVHLESVELKGKTEKVAIYGLADKSLESLPKA